MVFEIKKISKLFCSASPKNDAEPLFKEDARKKMAGL